MEDTVRPVLPVVMPEDPVNGKNERLESVLESALRGTRPVWLCTPEETENYFRAHRPKKGEEYRPVLFAAGLGEDGVNTGLTGLFRLLRGDQGLLEGYAGGVIADGMSDLYTKSAARELVFTANCAGCAFVGRPLVEATRTLSNFTISAQILSTDELTAYHQCAAVLVQEILSFRRNGPGNAAHFLSSREEERGEEMPGTLPADGRRPNLLVLHASLRKTSNTLALWHRTAEYLRDDLDIREISLQNGTLYDCAGCPYHTCLHYGERGSCFYGGSGIMAESVYPAVRRANGLVMICANYNDALSANLTAFINRLTALFRQVRFYDKALFAIVVSGYSGSDIIAEQLISALNMNKTFYLPAHFCMMETANNAGQALKLPGIEERIREFADRIRSTLCAEK